jgi:hypothetical protein
MPHGFHRFCIAAVSPCGIVSADASVRKVKLKLHHHAPHAIEIQHLVLLGHKLPCKSLHTRRRR